MSLQAISKDILLKAEKEKDLLDAQFKEEESLLESKLQEKISVYRDSLLSKHEAEVGSAKEKILGKYKKESKQIVLDTKSRLISKVYDESLVQILSMDKKDKEVVLSSLISKAKELIDYDEVVTSKDMEKIVKTKVKSGAKVHVEDDIEGLVFTGNSGKVRLDMTFNTLFREMFDDLDEKIQEVLFKSK